MEKFVVISTCPNHKEAYYLKYKLGEEGIESYLLEWENTSKEKDQTSPLKVQVNSDDVEKAIQVLIKIHQELKSIPPEEDLKIVKKILVPIDFSKNSATACLFAFALAKNLGAEIKLLHVYNDPFVDSGYIETRISFEKYERNILLEIEDMARRNILAFIQVLQTELQKFGLQDVRFHYNILKGKPEYQIINICEAFNPYMIVIGTQGTGKMPGDIVGSVTTKVIENTMVPILAIPENWNYKGFEKLNILYATDFYDADLNAFNNLIEILKPFNVHFDCVHIESNEAHPWKEMHLFKLESGLTKDYPDINFKCHLINHKQLLKGIQEFVDQNATDIISFTSPKRTILYKLLFPNNLKKMVYQSKIPLLIFRTDLEKTESFYPSSKKV